MKTCFKCGCLKHIDDFYKHPKMADGHLGKCKECNKKDVRENYALRREQYSRYDQERQSDPERRQRKLEYGRQHALRNPEKASARTKTRHYIRDGKLVKQPCKYCGSTKNIQAHHSDYAKPLDITWVCFKCHREKEHGQIVTVA